MLLDIPNYIHQCAPNVAEITMLAIIKTESRGNPLALSLNKGKKLSYQAKTYKQAVAWANYLENNKYNFDIGLAQVNIRNAHKYGYSAYQLLDPCTNLKVASDILQKNYNQALNKSGSQQDALMKAISAYNTGNYQSGFRNGYVYKVLASVTNGNNRQNIKQYTYRTHLTEKTIQSKSGYVQLTSIKTNE